ncbi:hypothetical protein LTR66_014605, partial [Elasticomyces elasticus]
MAGAVEDSPWFRERRAKGEIIVRDTPKFDLESYISNYEGRTRLHRLLHIAQHCPPLSLEALHLAIPEAKNGMNTTAYQLLVTLYHAINPESQHGVPDVEWVERVNKSMERESDRLESELRGYKNNLIKESIRMGHEDLATHQYHNSQLEAAGKSLSKMREYCTTPMNIASMTLKQVVVAIAQSLYHQALTYLQKVRVMSLKPDDKARVDPVVEACSGLAHLCCGQYKEAAAAFCTVDPSFMSNGPVAGINFAKEVLTGNDIAVYGGLCALASLNRHELTSKVLENANFRSFLELEPHIRRAINAFCGGKYSACLGALEGYRADYLLDVYLSSSVADLYSRIRTKSIVAYFLPYSCVQLSSLAAAFPAPHSAAADTPHDADDAADADEDTDAMESELTAMIQSGALRARIDTVSRLLV